MIHNARVALSCQHHYQYTQSYHCRRASKNCEESIQLSSTASQMLSGDLLVCVFPVKGQHMFIFMHWIFLLFFIWVICQNYVISSLHASMMHHKLLLKPVHVTEAVNLHALRTVWRAYENTDVMSHLTYWFANPVSVPHLHNKTASHYFFKYLLMGSRCIHLLADWKKK